MGVVDSTMWQYVGAFVDNIVNCFADQMQSKLDRTKRDLRDAEHQRRSVRQDAVVIACLPAVHLILPWNLL